MMTKILAIISTHGDELLGPKLLAYMLDKRSELLNQIEFVVANPRAYAQNVRYVESDLNRSYGLNLDTYEAQRAKLITERIRLLQPELVLDFHTTTASQPDLLITANPQDGATAKFIKASATRSVLTVKPLNDITTVAPHFAAYEVPNSHLGAQLYAQICADIKRYLDGGEASVEHDFYEMTGKITTEEAQNTPGLENFVYSDALKCIPMFIGEKAYIHDGSYVGFKAKKCENGSR